MLSLLCQELWYISRADCGRIWGGKSVRARRKSREQLAVAVFRDVIGNNGSVSNAIYLYAFIITTVLYIDFLS